MSLGITSADFTQILNDLGRTISYQKATKTVDPMNGSEIVSYAAASNQVVAFFLNQHEWIWEQYGLIQVGDAYAIAPHSLGFGKLDKFTIDGDEYIIKEAEYRYVAGVLMHDFCTCYKSG
jgi:hypothetical protein